MFPLLFLSSLALMGVVQSAVTRLGSRRGAEDLRLGPFEAAYLAGGRRRVVDAAIAGLAMSGRLLVDRRGRLTPVDRATTDDPVEQAVSDHQAVAERVRSRGLVVTGTRAQLWWTARLLPVALAAAGLATAFSDLTLMLVALAVPLFWVLFGRSSPHHRPTPLGRAVLRRLEKRYRVDDIDHERYLRQTAVEPWDPVAAVGVVGFSAVPSPDLRAALIRSRG